MQHDLPQPQSSEMLQNPARVPKKGRPTEREKRKKTLVEQRDDAQKKKAKQQEKKPIATEKQRTGNMTVRCKFCNEEGHNVQTCGPLKAATELAAAPLKCQFCFEVGHLVPTCKYLRAVMSADPKNAEATELKL